MKRFGKLALAAAFVFQTASYANAVTWGVGDVFVSTGNGTVRVYDDTSLALLETLNTGRGGFTTGSAFDSSGNFYVTDFSANSVTRFTGPNDPHNSSVFVNQAGSPEMIVFDTGGNAYVSSASSGFFGKYSSAGTLLQSWNTGLGRMDFFDLNAGATKAFFTIDISKSVFVLDLATSAVTTFNNSVGNFGLRVLGDGGLIVANQQDIKRLNSAGAVIQTYDTATENSWFALNLDPDGQTFWSADFSTGRFCQFNIATGALVRCGTALAGTTFGLAVFGELTQGGTTTGGTTGPRVPEPSALFLFGTGLLASVGYIRRRLSK